MKKRISVITVIIMLLIAGSISAFASDTYSDVNETHWAYEFIERCSDSSWFGGYPDMTFRPENSITRAEAMKVFVKFLGLPLTPTVSSTYYDVDVNEWFAPYIEAGKELFPKRMALDGEVKFQPNMPVTREDVIYAIVVSLGYSSDVKFVDESVLNMFSDQNSLSSNVRAYAAFAVLNNFVNGYTNGTIGGQDPLKRSEFAKLLSKASTVGYKRENAPIPKDVTVSPDTMVELQVGEVCQMSSVMTYTNGTSEDYSANLNAYAESDNNIVIINKNKITAANPGTEIIRFNDTHIADKKLVVVVKDDTRAPVINFDDYPAETEQNQLKITGSISDSSNSDVTLECNNSAVACKKNGSFSVYVDLKDGKNEIVFYAENGHKKSAEKSVVVYKKAKEPEKPKVEDDTKKGENDNDNIVTLVPKVTQPPVLTINSYEKSTYNDTITITGSIYAPDSDSVVLLCNNKTVSDSKGSFSITLNLTDTDNSFEFIAKDNYQKSDSKTITVTKNIKVVKTAPKINITDFEDTVKEEFSVIKGYVEDESDSVRLSCNGTDVAMSKNNFSIKVPLNTGKNKITFDASNSFNLTDSKTIYITREKEAEQQIITDSDKDNVTLSIKASASGDRVTVAVGYSGFSQPAITQTQFVLKTDGEKYDYDVGSSTLYFGGAAAYQKLKGGVRYVFTNSGGVKTQSGSFGIFSFKLKESQSFSESDFDISNIKIINNSQTYTDSDIRIIK